jgi:hypothetical protein
MLFAELTGAVTIDSLDVLIPTPHDSIFVDTRYHTWLLAKPWKRVNFLR